MAEIQAYASRTGTRTTLAALREHGWRLLVSATGVHRTEGMGYCLDNGAWTAHVQGTPWDEQAFVDLVTELGPGADFVIAPDVVAGGYRSLALSLSWVPTLRACSLVLVPVQDGMAYEVVAPYIDEWTGIFVGGSTEWKLATMAEWGRVARERDAYMHVGRVNTVRRIQACQLAGAHSFDGTSVTRFPPSLERLDRAVRQRALDFSEAA